MTYKPEVGDHIKASAVVIGKVTQVNFDGGYFMVESPDEGRWSYELRSDGVPDEPTWQFEKISPPLPTEPGSLIQWKTAGTFLHLSKSGYWVADGGTRYTPAQLKDMDYDQYDVLRDAGKE